MSTEGRSNCETYEILISTFLDEAIDRDEQRELLDHLVRCPACRELYAEGRALEGLVALASEGSVAQHPSPGLWDRIESRASEPPAKSEGSLKWAWRAAAIVLLGVALAFAPWPDSRSDEISGRQMEIVLEQDRGDMTDGRFLQLAAEILRADRRYHFAMREVMDKVVDDEWGRDGSSSEGLTEDRTSDQDEEEGSPFRV
jgi:hypothetical protein